MAELRRISKSGLVLKCCSMVKLNDDTLMVLSLLHKILLCKIFPNIQASKITSTQRRLCSESSVLCASCIVETNVTIN